MLAASGSTFLDSITNHIQERGLGVVGSTLFIHQMPESAFGALVLDNFLMGSIDSYIPELNKTQFRVIVRAANYTDAFALSKDIAGALLQLQRKALPGVEIKTLRQLHQPLAFPLSINTNSAEVVTNYSAAYGRIST